MVSTASSVSTRSTRSTSPLSNASAKRATTSRSRVERGSGALSSAPAGSRPSHHVAQHEDRALAGRQVGQRGHERQADGLARLIPGRRARGAVRQPVEQSVRIGLQPDRLDAPRRLRRLTRRFGHRARPPRRRPQRVQAAIRRDPVQPRPQRRARRVAVEPAPRRQQRLLQQVLGVLHRADDPVAVKLQLAPVGIGQLAERVLVSRACAGERSVRQHGHRKS
jgi:hypothetical protein